MKKFLKIIITVAIIVGIVFGVRYLVGQNRTEDYLFTTLTTKKEKDSINKASGENNLSAVLSFINNTDNSSKVDERVKLSILDGGRLDCLQTIYEECDENFNYYFNLLCLDKGGNKSGQDKILNYYDQIVEQIKEQQSALNRVYTMTTKTSTLNKADFKGAFDKFVNQYAQTVKLYANMCESLRTYILNGIYNGINVEKQFVYNEISTKMNVFALDNEELLVRAKTIIDAKQSNSMPIVYINFYQQLDDFDEFIKSENINAFIETKEDVEEKMEYRRFKAFLWGEE